jgi:hypothetical protein
MQQQCSIVKKKNFRVTVARNRKEFTRWEGWPLKNAN